MWSDTARARRVELDENPNSDKPLTSAQRETGANVGGRCWRGRHSGERLETECGGVGRDGVSRTHK